MVAGGSKRPNEYTARQSDWSSTQGDGRVETYIFVAPTHIPGGRLAADELFSSAEAAATVCAF